MSTSTKPSETAESGGFVDVDKSWHPTLQLFLESVGSLVLAVDDVAEVYLEARTAPRIDEAESFLIDRLTSGAFHYRDLIADGAAIGVSQSALYRARRRMGLATTDRFWALPEATVGSQQ